MLGRRAQLSGSFARTGLPAGFSATYDSANRMVTLKPAGANKATAQSYDLAGSLTGDGTFTYVWNARNELAQIKQNNTVTSSYAYDPLGRRARKTIGSVTTLYGYDGPNIIQEQGASAVPTANLLGGPGYDTIYSRTDSAGQRSFLTDALGSTLALTDPAKALATTYTAEPYGKTTTTGTPSSNPFQYTGRDNDTTGLQYNRARYYNPTTGRFITEDPIGLAGGQLDYYSYTNSDPINGYDLNGLACGQGDQVQDFVDRKRSFPLGISKVVRVVSLCGGKPTGKGQYSLTHINHGGHFGGMLGSSDYALDLVAATIDQGSHGDYKGGSGVTNYRQTFFCTTPELSDFKFSFSVRVAVRNSDSNFITTFIENDYLDGLDPDYIQSSCRAGHAP